MGEPRALLFGPRALLWAGIRCPFGTRVGWLYYVGCWGHGWDACATLRVEVTGGMAVPISRRARVVDSYAM